MLRSRYIESKAADKLASLGNKTFSVLSAHGSAVVRIVQDTTWQGFTRKDDCKKSKVDAKPQNPLILRYPVPINMRVFLLRPSNLDIFTAQKSNMELKVPAEIAK